MASKAQLCCLLFFLFFFKEYFLVFLELVSNHPSRCVSATFSTNQAENTIPEAVEYPRRPPNLFFILLCILKCHTLNYKARDRSEDALKSGQREGGSIWKWHNDGNIKPFFGPLSLRTRLDPQSRLVILQRELLRGFSRINKAGRACICIWQVVSTSLLHQLRFLRRRLRICHSVWIMQLQYSD